MSKKSFIYLCSIYWLIIGLVVYLYLDDTADEVAKPKLEPVGGSAVPPVDAFDAGQGRGELPIKVSASAMIPVEANGLPSAQVIVPERFPNESKVREVLGLMKEGMAAGNLSDIAYEAYLMDLETLMADAHPHYAEMWALIQSELSFLPGQDAKRNTRESQLFEDVQLKFGFVLGQAAPEQSLDFARQAGPQVLAGWLSGQIEAGNDFMPLLESANLAPAPEVYWEALMDVAKTDTLLSLDAILEGHMDSMNLDKWKQILFSRGNSGDTALASWFEQHIGQLMNDPNFDEIEVVRMLRRYDDGEGPFLASADLARVDAAKSSKDYAQAARILEELSLQYGDVIDAAAAERFPVDWSKQDFLAASNWILEHSDQFSDPESMESLLGTMYRHKARNDPDFALQYGMQIEDEHLRALVLSNTVIPQLEKNGTEYPVEWVSELPQGFVKQRSMAGYVLGLSRNRKESTLEAQVKFQFLKDEFDLSVIQNQVLDSQLSSQDKIKVIELLNTY